MAKIKGWTKTTKRTMTVWNNDVIRVIVDFGDRNWVAYYERNIGKIASDSAFISNATIAVASQRTEAEKEAIDWIRKYNERVRRSD